MTTEPQPKEHDQEERKEESDISSLPAALKAFSGAPTQEQIEQWKIQFNEVFVSGFSDTELFVWRPLTRPEWVKLQTVVSNPEAQVDQYKFEEMVCDACVLWKSVEKNWEQGKAGTPTSLQEQILQNSNFFSPQAASLLVAKL
jgi:hypothetical protein